MASTCFKRRFVDVRILGKIGERADLREHAQDLLERAHLADLLQLIAEIFEREISLRRACARVRAAFCVDGLLGALDQRHQSPMPMTRETMRSG